MNTAEMIYREAQALPEHEAREVLDFLEFLKAKRDRSLEVEEVVVNRLRARFAHIPSGESMADELIAERRLAARLENLP